MDHYISPVFKGPQQIRSGKGAVHHQRDLVLVGNGRHRINVDQVGIGVAHGFNVDGLGVFPDRFFKNMDAFGGIHESGLNAEIRERVFKQVVGPAVYGGGADNVLTGMDQGLHGVGHGSGTAGRGQGSHPAFQGGDPFFKDIFRRVGQTAVYIARILQGKTVSGMLAVPEYVRRGLVNGHCPGIGGRIGLFLPYMELQGLKMVFLFFAHCHCLPKNPFSFNYYRLSMIYIIGIQRRSVN